MNKGGLSSLQRLDEDKTPADMNMEDNDVIDAMVTQIVRALAMYNAYIIVD